MSRRSFNLTPEQKAKADERQAQKRALFERLAKMPAEDRAALAMRMPIVTVEGHPLSAANCCLVALQCPSATLVGGFRQWIANGRCVKKGERGMVIRVPGGKKGEPAAAGGNPDAAAEESSEGGSVFFITGSVFDISQTAELADGAEAESEASK